MIVGVNVFFLISGYFKINFSVKKLLRLFGELVFYSFAIYLVFLILGLATFRVSDVLRFTILAINDHWFVICYFILMLLSPYLNMLIEEISKDKKKYGILLLILFLVLCVYGFVFSIPWIGVYDGYSLIYAVFLYLAGRYIRVFGVADKGKAGYTFLIYGACALLNWGLVNICIITKHGWFAWHLYSYNNPLILVESIALLTLFLKWKQVGSLGEKIAMLGKYTFGVYLLHTHQLVLKWRFAPLKSITEGKHWTFWALSILVYCLVLYAGCMLIEILRSILTDFIRKRLNPAK